MRALKDTTDESPPNACACSFLTLYKADEGSCLPLSTRPTIWYLFTTHLASLFDVINKGNNFGARIF